MRLSRFNLYVEGFPQSGSTLVHNTLSGAYTVLDDETMAALWKLDAGDELGARERELACDPDLLDPDVAVVVESIEAEEAEFQAWFERKRRKTSKLDVLVSVNLACNFDCPYCCQAGILDGTVMKPAVADRTADWIATRALEVGVEAVHIAFCGGEPLLHPERIKRIATHVRERIGRHGLELRFGLITNAYFLTEEMVSDLLPYGLSWAQITIDGDESTHRLTRVSKKGEDTFARIFGHAIAASRRIRVSINGNYTEKTRHGFLPLLEKLSAAGLPRNTKVSFTPALEILTAIDWNGGGMCTWSEADTAMHIAMQDEILRRGYDTAPIATVGPCEFHDHHSFAIDPDGTIYKCPGFLGKPSWGIGHVDSGLVADRYRTMIRATPQASCDGCAHRPNCGGGCVAAEWLKTGEASGVNCEKPFFERVKEESIVRQFLLATSDTVEEAVAAFPPPRRDQTGHTRARRSPALRVMAA
jgi:uncharacterized protein